MGKSEPKIFSKKMVVRLMVMNIMGSHSVNITKETYLNVNVLGCSSHRHFLHLFRIGDRNLNLDLPLLGRGKRPNL